MSSDMEISYDKDLYLMLKRLKHTQNNTITPKYHHYQKSLDSKKMCYTENSENANVFIDFFFFFFFFFQMYFFFFFFFFENETFFFFAN